MPARVTSRLGTGLAIIDLDHFKTLNDTYGHPVGDAALVHVAALLRTTCPSKATVARLGGDELAVLLPCVTREEVARGRRTVPRRYPHQPDEPPRPGARR